MNDPAKEMVLQREHLSQGACISWDQYVVPHRGRLYMSAGREKESLRFGGGSLAVDHTSKRVFIHHQVALDASHTLIGQRLLERDVSISNGTMLIMVSLRLQSLKPIVS